MRDDLLLYYERELTFLRQMGAEFAAKYPKVASRLVLEPDKCEDPHVERMLEAFAFLTARVHLKIDDEFPEITEALLSILHPHYLRPIPSMSVAEFHMDTEQAVPPGGLKLDRGSVLNSRPVNGVPCKFRTCYDLTFWPLAVTEAEWKTPDRLQPPIKSSEAVAAVRIGLRCPGDLRFDKLELSSLRFYLNGESNLVHTLYELLCNNCSQIVMRDTSPKSKAQPVILGADALRPVGFGEDDGMLPYPRRSFIGYRLLQEYFCFPQKFFFLDLTGLERICEAGFGGQAEILLLISPFERAERRQTAGAGSQRQDLPAGLRADREPVRANRRADPAGSDGVRIPGGAGCEPAQGDGDFRDHGSEERQSADPAKWCSSSRSTRTATAVNRPRCRHSGAPRGARRATRDDEGTEVFLSLVDLSSRPVRPNLDALTVRTICTNRDLPARLPFGNEGGDFELEGAVPVKRIVALIKPTDTLRPPVGKDSMWRLVSHLSLNYLSLVEDGREALQEILRLYNFTGSTYSEKQIEGIDRGRAAGGILRAWFPKTASRSRAARRWRWSSTRSSSWAAASTCSPPCWSSSWDCTFR